MCEDNTVVRRIMRRLNVIKVIPLNITHGVVKGDDKSPWDDHHNKTVYHENSIKVEEDEDLDIREENDDYNENTRDKKISFIRQVTFIDFCCIIS